LQVLTIGQHAHLDVTSTKVNQTNLKHVCLNFTLINAFTMYALLSSNVITSFLQCYVEVVGSAPPKAPVPLELRWLSVRFILFILSLDAMLYYTLLNL